MKDIDFDELDRAVGTVLGTDAAAPKSSDVVLPDTTSAEPTSPVEVATATATGASASTPPTGTPTIKPATSPARKRGQFLDMVHPSANMRGGKAPLPNGPRKTLAPLSTVDSSRPVEEPDSGESLPDPSSTSPVEASAASPEPLVPQDTPVDEPSEDTSSEVPAENVALASDTVWPDPLDVNKDTDVKKDDDAEVDAIADGANSESATQTPFVPGVEVEKRPLGGVETSSISTPDPLPSTEALTSPDVSSDEPESASGSAGVNSSADISGPELSQELNSIESNDVSNREASADTAAVALSEVENTESATDVAAESTPETEQGAETEPEETEPPVPVEAAPAPQPIAASEVQKTPLGAQSAPQQQKPVAAGDDDDNHPLFDAQEYHQPLLPPGKSKHGKSIFLIILFAILVLVGCALGYVAFTMGL